MLAPSSKLRPFVVKQAPPSSETSAAGDFHTLAVKTDGTLWAWGNNGSGQLGDGTVTSRLTPVQVP